MTIDINMPAAIAIVSVAFAILGFWLEKVWIAATAAERRGVERRNLTALDVIDRWKLSYRLSRVIEIISTARKVPLTKADAVSMAKLIREHVRGQ